MRKKIKTYFFLLLISYIAYQPFYSYFNSIDDFKLNDLITAVLNLTAIKLLGLGLYFMVRYLIEKERFYKASINAKEQELEILKGQLNPHFLFNALNNIYSSLITDNKNGQELILKLSELMRYIIDSSSKPSVSISEEVRFIENYISFEKERLGDRCEIIFNKKIENADLNVAPLILFTFIENAFKHGTLAIQKSVIEISLITGIKNIELRTFNPVYNTIKNSTKLGLKNTTRRLELLYPNRHKLIIESNEVNYSVNLKVEQK